MGEIKVDIGFNSQMSVLLGPYVIGTLFYNQFIDLVVLYDLKGKLREVRADEKFERIS